MDPLTARVSDITVSVMRPTAPTTKPPVLLVHGMFGGAWHFEGYQRLLAERGYESHALNLRGHHGSRPVSDVGRISVADYIDDAAEVARALRHSDGRGPFVIGYSMGGLIAQKLAESGVSRATVLLSSAPPRWIPVVSWLLLRKQLKYAKGLFMFEPLLPDRGDADALMFNRTPMADRERLYSRLVPESGRAGFDLSFGAIDVRAHRVTAPTLVVTGTDDRFVVPRVARALARKYQAPLREYQSFAHHIVTEPGWERPATEIIAWIDSL